MFETLYKISQMINSSLDPNEVLSKMMDIVIEHTSAERGFIISTEGFEIARNMDKKTIEESVPKTIIEEIYKNKKPIITFDAQVEVGSESIIKGRLRSICAVPLIYLNNIYGIIYIDSSMKKGAFTDETKKFLELFSHIAVIALLNAIKFDKLKKEYNELKSFGIGNIVGVSKSMQIVYDLIKKASSTDCPVFIVGESGTGKELVARAIHQHSNRSKYEFVPIYCGGLPESLIESELFGYKKGAFTGADKDKPGLFEFADNGTLFLDEVCDIPLITQTKLLRVLQEGEIRRIGETKTKKVNVRVISATNKDVKNEIKEKRFREDLYYRLNVLEIKLPPLRERKEDIPLLVNYFLQKYCKKYNKEITITQDGINKLQEMNFPGNVRELENLVQKIIVTAEKKIITEKDIPIESNVMGKNELTLDEIEKQIIKERLLIYKGDKKAAANSLGMPLRTLYHKLKQWKE